MRVFFCPLALFLFFRLYLIRDKINYTEKGNKMTKHEFNIICGELLIDESIALENEDLRDILKQVKNPLISSSQAIDLVRNCLINNF